MSTTFRAALAVVMLAGFYVVAGGLIVGFGLLSIAAFQHDAGTAGAKLAFVALIAAAGVVVGLWRVARARPEPEPGIVLTPQEAPELWAIVRELADAAQTDAPAEIRLVPDVNAAVSEDARFLGLVPGPRRLYLGLPLLMGLDVSQVRSVIAHELGHYSRSHTRLAPIVYRGQVAIFGTIDQLSGNIVGWFLRGYAMLHLLVSAAVTRRQELEADELSVRIAGRCVTQSALRELPVIDSSWSFYQRAYLAPGWDEGLAPTADQFFSGFGHVLAERADEISRLREQDPPREESRWDTHPSIAARISAMARMSSEPLDRDTRPAVVLVPQVDEVGARLADLTVAFGERARMGWPELTAAATTVGEQRSADVIYRSVARLTEQPRATLGTVLDLIAVGRAPQLNRDLGVSAATTVTAADEVTVTASDADATSDPTGTDPQLAPDSDDTQPTFADALVTLLGAALVAAGAARWQHSWSGPVQLLSPDGEEVPVAELASLMADPAHVAEARERLIALGVDTESTGQVSERATAHGGEVLGGLATMKVDGKEHDVLVLDRGLILIPCPKKTDGGRARLEALLADVPVLTLAEQHRFLAFEDVATCTVHKSVPAYLELSLHTGETVTLKESWSGQNLTKDSSDTLVAIARDIAAARV